jgi:preprotein translocase subunit Sec63
VSDVMSSVNNQSVREEAEGIEQLTLNNKINSETKMLFQSMLMLLNWLISIFLEKSTSQNNRNSSKPFHKLRKMNLQLQKKLMAKEKIRLTLPPITSGL